MDGSNRLTVIWTSLYYPFGIAIDPVGNRIYWCDDGVDNLESSDLFGNFREILLEDSFVGNPFDVAIHAEYLYWTDYASGKLKRINRYESNGSSEQVGSNVFATVRGLHVYEVDVCSSSPCQNNGTCLDNIDSFQCSCPEGFAGTLCEEDINECGNFTCKNNAICVDGFVCICQPGFYGLSCETVYLCDDSICDEGDVCLTNGQEHICYNNNDVNATGTVLGYFIAEGLLVVIVAINIIAAIVFAYKRYNQRKKFIKGSDSINMTVKNDGDNYDDVIVDTMSTRAGRDAHNLNRVNTADPQYINKIETKTQQVADSSYEVLHTYSNTGAVYTDLKK